MFVSGNQQVHSLGAFKGIVDLTDELKSSPQTVKYSVGGYYGVHADFTRIPGKKLVTSNSTFGGAVMSIHQLAFSDSTAVVYHSSTGYYATTVAELGILAVSNTSTSILGPIVPPP